MSIFVPLKGVGGKNCVKFGPKNVYIILCISANVNNYFGLLKTHSFTNSINNTRSGRESIDQNVFIDQENCG